MLRRYLAAVLRFKWLVVLTTVLGAVCGVAATRYVRPGYRAQATVWVEESSEARGPIRAEQLLRSTAWVDLLKSYIVLDEAVRQLQLFVVPDDPSDSTLFLDFGLQSRFATGEFCLQVDEASRQMALVSADSVLETATIGDSVGGSVGFAWLPTAHTPRLKSRTCFLVMHPRDAAVGLSERLVAQTDRGGSFLFVELAGTQPVRIAATVNAVVERFVEVAAQLKRERLTQLASILRTQLRNAEENLRRAETELEDFRIQTITLPQEAGFPIAPGLDATRDPAYRDFFDMRVELESIRRDRAAVERALARGREGELNPDAFSLIGAVQTSPEMQAALLEYSSRRAELRALERLYTPEHPQVQRKSQEIAELGTRTIPEIGSALLAELAARESDLENLVGSASRQMRDIPPRSIQEGRLERDVQISATIYTTLQGRYEEARLAEASSIPDVRVLDPAVVPQRPVQNLALKLLAAALAAGFGLGIGGALVIDYFDRRVRYPDQVTQDMGLTILGVVPHVRGTGNGRAAAPETAPVVEALRGIRLNLVHAYGTAGPIVLTVTSPGKGDGKSFISSNLALAFADAGHRTLLIDADSRRGALHRVLNAARKPGLTDLLSGDASSDQVRQSTQYPNLHFLGGGTRMANAPELLGSVKMTEVLARLRSGYAVIIVDSPPLGAGVDAFALGTLTGNMIIVLRTGATDRSEAEAKLDLLDRLPVRILGAVLNDAREQKAYGYRYYSYYMDGYEHESEIAEPDATEEIKLVEGPQ